MSRWNVSVKGVMSLRKRRGRSQTIKHDLKRRQKKGEMRFLCPTSRLFPTLSLAHRKNESLWLRYMISSKTTILASLRIEYVGRTLSVTICPFMNAFSEERSRCTRLDVTGGSTPAFWQSLAAEIFRQNADRCARIHL